ncbi:MAG: helix-turn-helix transcriptional regulator, partial [Candidatus Cloacimonetes bacterium]|nr:helix-turn-helix transcriptional regulator [Candidatus Cloacimonadota bacterium]
AFGIFDLFWWSIFGEMLDLHSNPAKILGVGLSANVLGVLAGGYVGSILFSAELQSLQTTLLALAVVCVTSALLPPLHKHLSVLLQDHIFLTTYSAEAINSHAAPGQPTPGQPAPNQPTPDQPAPAFIGLSNRESEVAARLLQGKTYRMIASELCVSENTVKYYVKNIYAKYGVQSRGQFVATVLAQETDGRSS